MEKHAWSSHAYYIDHLPCVAFNSPIGRLAGPFGLANYVEDFKIYIFAVEIHLAAPLRPCLRRGCEDTLSVTFLPNCAPNSKPPRAT